MPAAFVNFVPDTPHNDAGMVAVAEDHAVYVALPPIIKTDVIIVSVFSHAPAVEGFVDYQHAQPVASIQEGWCGWIVRAADGIEPAGFEHFNFALLSAVITRCAQDAVIVMDATTF